MFCMITSSSYHLFCCISESFSAYMFKLDLFGIGIMMFSLVITCTYGALHAHHYARNLIIGTMLTIFFSNMLIQSMPCYKRFDNDCVPVIFYVLITSLCLTVAVSWYFYFASKEELQLFAGRIGLSWICLIAGSFFFWTYFPERYFPNSRFVQLCLQSHIWWHVLTFMNAYILYWFLFDILIYSQ